MNSFSPLDCRNDKSQWWNARSTLELAPGDEESSEVAGHQSDLAFASASSLHDNGKFRSLLKVKSARVLAIHMNGNLAVCLVCSLKAGVAIFVSVFGDLATER